MTLARTRAALALAPSVLTALVLAAGCQATIAGQPAGDPDGVAASATSSTRPQPSGASERLEFRTVLRAVPSGTTFGPTPVPASPDAVAAARQARQSADEVAQEQAIAALDCGAPDPLIGHVDPAAPLVTCAADGTEKYVLDVATLTGRYVADVSTTPSRVGPGYAVTLTFTTSGTAAWAAYTAGNIGQRVAIALDGVVILAPDIIQPITGGVTEIDAGHDRDQARRLADQIAGR